MGLYVGSTSSEYNRFEYGDWTPGIYSQDTNRYAFSNLTVLIAKYVLTGKVCTAWCNMTFDGDSITSYDNIGITSWPFVTLNETSYATVGSISISSACTTADAAVKAGVIFSIGANSNHATVGTRGTVSGQYEGNFSQHMVDVTGGQFRAQATYMINLY
tara:strand:- start:272 stop:748 length:477 start_codon:yes stop_codon:yes gene_type:complete